MLTENKSKFNKLQVDFRQQLLENILNVEDLWASLNKNVENKILLKELYSILLQLADTGGTYGADEVSSLARELELKFKLLLNESNISTYLEKTKENLDTLFSNLKNESEKWISEELPDIKIKKSKQKIESDLIYTLLGDEVFAADLILNIEKYSCNIRHFHELDVLEAACEVEMPAVIAVDEDFFDSDIGGVNVVSQLKTNIKNCAPIIYINSSNDAESRLIAAKANVDRYFTKPVAMNKLAHTIKGLVSQVTTSPYRILLIDDDIPLLECYETILSESGLIVEAINDPLKAFSSIDVFQPDIIVVDMYMPKCTGTELVHMIRQDDRWELIPVIFLSAEQDISSQLEAMMLGADDFLVKPVNTNRLLATVNTAAKRARNTVKLNQDLKNTLQENKYQLVSLDEHAIVSSADVTGNILHVNNRLCEISGYTRNELVGNDHRILKSTHHDDAFFKNLWATIVKGNVWKGVICNLSKEGNEYWVDSTIVPFLDQKGKPYKYVSIRTDVTHIRINEERLKRSQEFANIGSWDWNVNSGELIWSDRIWPLFGYKKEITETSYENFISAVHPDDRLFLQNAITRCVEKGEEYDIEHRVVWADGSVHWLHECGDVVRNNAGEAQHMLGVVQDITSIKDGEIRQTNNNIILELIVKGVKLSMVLKQIISHAEMMLPNAICSILLLDDSGKRLDTCIAPRLPEFYNEAITGLEIGLGVGSCGEAAYTGKRVIAKDIMTHPSWLNYKDIAGKANLKTCWAEPFISSQKEVLGTFAIYFNESKDISDTDLNLMSEIAHLAAIAVEREKSQLALMSAKEEAESANLAKSQFLSSMSHELRTPMNAIMGFSQLLKITKSHPLTELQGKNVDEIMVAGKHLMRLIDEVLDLAKIEAGHIDLQVTEVVVSKIVNECMQLILPLAQNRGIDIFLVKNGVELTLEKLQKEKGSIWLDETRLKQIILNLLSNAVKYNKENGKITLHCETCGDNMFRISVSDTGAGLNEEQQQHLFKAFDRLGFERTETEGTGIGLVITKNIVELMGGIIYVQSEKNKGSTFIVELPICKDRNDSISNAISNPSLMENEMTERKDKKSVLYIEDNPANLRLVEQILMSVPNIHMWSAPEPMLGIELALEHLPDLILLDINLPGMNGYDVLKYLRENDASKNIPVIAVSANAMPRDLEQGKAAGFDDYITKPVNVKDLLVKVKSQLDN